MSESSDADPKIRTGESSVHRAPFDRPLETYNFHFDRSSLRRALLSSRHFLPLASAPQQPASGQRGGIPKLLPRQ